MLTSKPLLLFSSFLTALINLVAVIAAIDPVFVYIFVGIIGLVISIVILYKPYIGIALILASLVIVDALPSLPFISSATVLLGGITLVAYFIVPKRRSYFQKTRSINKGFLILIALVFWIVVSNPSAAFLGDSRSWAFTYIQLLILAWLGGKLLTGPKKNWWVFLLFIFASDVSAVVSINNGFIGTNIVESIRVGGLTTEINTVARYYVLGLLFLYYIFSTREKGQKWVVMFSIGSSILLILGVAFTVSRTGIILLLVLAGLILFKPNTPKAQKWPFLFWGLSIVLFMIPENVFTIAGSKILPSILEGSDTVGLRYSLWEAGIKMFLDHPLSGVGIGQFSNNVQDYATGGLLNFKSLNPHSLYIQVISEIGIIGAFIFLSAILYAIVFALKNEIFLQRRSTSIVWIWFSVVVIILIGGITKTALADKFLWIALGVIYYSNSNYSCLQNNTTS